MPAKRRGRPRSLNYRKRVQVRDLVAGGAKLAEAAVAVGVSTRTIQREARWDPDFDQELREAQATPADPLRLMQSAARTHWRAAAWLLERENPERYARRPASSCSPQQFDDGLRTVLEAALRFAPPEVRSELFDHLELACEAAFKAVFPLVDQWGGRRHPQLPPTPLADQEKIRQSRRSPAIADDGDAVSRLLARFPAPEAKPSPGGEFLRNSQSISEKSTHVDKSLRDLKPMAKPSTPCTPHAPRDERLSSPHAPRVARTTSTILPDLDDEGDKKESDILSPKTHSATKSRLLAPREEILSRPSAVSLAERSERPMETTPSIGRPAVATRTAGTTGPGSPNSLPRPMNDLHLASDSSASPSPPRGG